MTSEMLAKLISEDYSHELLFNIKWRANGLPEHKKFGYIDVLTDLQEKGYSSKIRALESLVPSKRVVNYGVTFLRAGPAIQIVDGDVLDSIKDEGYSLLDSPSKAGLENMSKAMEIALYGAITCAIPTKLKDNIAIVKISKTDERTDSPSRLDYMHLFSKIHDGTRAFIAEKVLSRMVDPGAQSLYQISTIFDEQEWLEEVSKSNSLINQ